LRGKTRVNMGVNKKPSPPPNPAFDRPAKKHTTPTTMRILGVM
jgi:hypothetical protein